MSTAAIRGLMEDGERVLAKTSSRGRTEADTAGRDVPAFYLEHGGRYARYPYVKVRAATFDAHDIFIALDGQAVRLKYRPGHRAQRRLAGSAPSGGAGPSLTPGWPVSNTWRCRVP